MAEERPRTLVMSEIMTPNMTNFSGNIHGGYLLSLLDKVAYACAAQYAAMPIVTLSVDQVYFKEPLYVGDLVTCYASVNFVGRSSMEIGIKVEAEDLMTRKKRKTNTCYFTMVAIGKEGKPARVPELTLNTKLEKRRFEEAKARRQHRLEYFKKHMDKKAASGNKK